MQATPLQADAVAVHGREESRSLTSQVPFGSGTDPRLTDCSTRSICTTPSRHRKVGIRSPSVIRCRRVAVSSSAAFSHQGEGRGGFPTMTSR
jgi:hypothetical protein